MKGAVPVRYGFGDLLFKVGDIASSVYLIRAGQVLLEAVEGPQIPTVRLFKGELFGECTWDHPPIHKATATVLEDAEVWRFSLKELYALMTARQPGILQAVQEARTRQAAWRRLRTQLKG